MAWVVMDGAALCRRLEWREIFGNDNPVEMDLGAGDGGFVEHMARIHPERNFLAVERLMGRCRKIVKKAARGSLVNLRLVRLESAYVMERLVPPGSVAIVHLMFPDPWPKRRHWGKRMVQSEFIGSVAKALKPGGEFRWTTDHAEYFRDHSPIVDACPSLQASEVWDLSDYPKTDFEEGFVAEGRTIWRKRWIKQA